MISNIEKHVNDILKEAKCTFMFEKLRQHGFLRKKGNYKGLVKQIYREILEDSALLIDSKQEKKWKNYLKMQIKQNNGAAVTNLIRLSIYMMKKLEEGYSYDDVKTATYAMHSDLSVFEKGNIELLVEAYYKGNKKTLTKKVKRK